MHDSLQEKLSSDQEVGSILSAELGQQLKKKMATFRERVAW